MWKLLIITLEIYFVKRKLTIYTCAERKYFLFIENIDLDVEIDLTIVTLINVVLEVSPTYTRFDLSHLKVMLISFKNKFNLISLMLIGLKSLRIHYR